VIAEARRRNLALTLRQLFTLRTIRTLAATIVESVVPLGRTSPTVLRLPEGVEVTARPGIAVDGRLVTVDPGVADDSLADLVTASGPAPDAPGALLPASTVEALAGEAHEAYATTTLDLVIAAALRALDATAIAVPAGLLRVTATSDDEDLIRAVKAARRSLAEDDPAVPAVRLIPVPASVAVTDAGAGDRVIVTVAGARVLGPDDLAARVRDRLVELVDHCRATDVGYSAADFPDSGLDEDAVARLLSGLDVSP
jgi:hypothetical protein